MLSLRHTRKQRRILAEHRGLRLLLRIGLFSCLLLVLAATQWQKTESLGEPRRVLAQTPASPFTDKQLTNGAFLLYLLGVFYMFIALSLVCDEFFVPALEVMQDHWEISPDVAGATLMAAGGSAPELFTSILGTLVFVDEEGNPSDVGFGTIVGSAVFNVLFVIAMCALSSNEVLEVSAWPLGRDSSYYCLTLICLALFFGVSSEGEIQGWEAAVLFLLYFGYVGVMKIQPTLQKLILGKVLEEKEPAGAAPVDEAELTEKPTSSAALNVESGSSEEEEKGQAPEQAISRQASIPEMRRMMSAVNRKRSTSVVTNRAGLYELLLEGKPIEETAAIYLVQEVQGDLHQTFNFLDENKSGTIGREEFEKLMKKFPGGEKKEVVDKAMSEIDKDGDGELSFEEFAQWYMHSELRIAGTLSRAFKVVDADHNGYVDRDELKAVLQLVGHGSTAGDGGDVASLDEDVDRLMKELDKDGDNKVDEQEFMSWYTKSPYWAKHKAIQEEEAKELEGLNLDWPTSAKPTAPLCSREDSSGRSLLRRRVVYLVLAPLTFSMYYTLPNVFNPAKRTLSKGLLGFFGSIVWIAVFSFFMVWWAGVVGEALGIPDSVMGLTILAAGTSVPDLLTSMIVAKQGKGDMAVSSSIGSNIFDVTVGLPLPWMLFTIIYGRACPVTATSLLTSILLLFGMIASVIVIIAMSGWKLTRGLAYSMIFLYLLFIWQDLMTTYCMWDGKGGECDSA